MITWDRTSSKYLWSTLVVATIAACGAFVYISFSFGNSHSSTTQTSKDFLSNSEKFTAEKCTTVCGSKECVNFANMLLDYVNPNADPCENFFQFACGKLFEIFGSEKYYSQAERYSNDMTAKLKRIIDNIKADPHSPSGKMKVVYDSCMKHSASDLKSLPTLLDFLRSVGMQDWPNLAADFQFTDINLPNTIAKFLAHKEYGFIDFSPSLAYMYLDDPNLKVSSTVDVTKSPFEISPEPTKKYLVDRILNYFNLYPEAIAEIWKESQAIQDAIISLRKESQIQYEHKDFEDFLDCSQDHLNEWTDICQSLESLIELTNAREKVSKDYVDIEMPKEISRYVLKNIFPLLRNFTDRSVANYLALNVFFNHLDELNFYFRLTHDKVRSLEGPDVSNLKWKKCTRWISSHMAFAMGYEYVKTAFPTTLLQDVQSIGEECISETVELISRQEWLTEEEKRNINEKVADTRMNMEQIIEMLTNETQLQIFYEQFHPTEDNFFYNVLQHSQFMKTNEMHGLFRIVENNFFKSLFDVNAGGGGYSIELYLGLLLPPSYTPGLERFINLLSLGFVLLHELGHNLEGYLIYSTNTSGYYEDKVQCLADQYSQFTLETIGKNLVGSQYHKENFADTIAISVLDKLIEKYSAFNSSYLMPSLPYSLEQQMFISTLNMLCTIHTKEADEQQYFRSGHTPQRFRINGIMQNSKIFSKVFGCTEKSFMNPSTKCFFLQ